MFAQDYLILKLVRVDSQEVWSYKQDGFCVLLANAGTGQYSVGNLVQPFGSGDILVLKGPTEVRIQAAAGKELIFSCFALRLEHLYPLFGSAEIAQLETVAEALHRARHVPATQPLAKQCHRLVEEVTPQATLDHRSQLLRIAAVILSEEFKKHHERRAGSLGVEEHLLQIFEGLSAEELLTISVGDLAAKFSCSRRHLNRLFHQYFGFSVSSLRMEMRLLKSISLLRDTNAKIINVAEQCGFNHLGLFNTCFKRRFGLSPGQWRKQAVEAENPPLAAGPPSPSGPCPLHSKGLCPLTGAYGVIPGENLPGTLRPATSIMSSALNGAAANPIVPINPLHSLAQGGGNKLTT